MKTCHSDYGIIQRIVLNPASNSFFSQEKIDDEFEPLNYLSKPSLATSIQEYQGFEEILLKSGIEALKIPHHTKASLDAIYCRDASLATDFGIILCRMGKAERSIEPEMQKEFYLQHDFKILGEIEAPGTVEGGDMCWLDEKTLAIGHTYRTNYEGIEQIKALLNPRGIDVFMVELPHFRGPKDVFHLMSVFSPVDKNKAVVYSPLMPIYFRNELLARNYQLIECPNEEFDTMGCNVLALAPSQCLVVDGNPVTKSRLEQAGCQVLTYQGEHISNPGCGGPTCLTRPLERKI